MNLRQVLSENRMIQETIRSNGALLQPIWEFLEEDYESMKIMGSLMSAEYSSRELVITYRNERNVVRIIQLKTIKFYLEGFRHNLSSEDATRATQDVVSYLEEVESFITLLFQAARKDDNIRQFFSDMQTIDWKGTLTELAQIAITQYQENEYRTLKKACDELAKKYTIDDKEINLKSLYSLARGSRSGNRL